MARELKTRGYKYARYKPGDITKKVVNITKDCPKMGGYEKCLLLYIRRRGRTIVEIFCPDKGRRFVGDFESFLLDILDDKMNIPSKYNDIIGLGRWAKRLGLLKVELRMLIKTHAPE